MSDTAPPIPVLPVPELALTFRAISATNVSTFMTALASPEGDATLSPL